MKKMIKKLAVLGGLTLVLGVMPASMTFASAFVVSTNDRADVSFVTTNPCTGEAVLFNGEIHETFHSTLDANSGAHVIEHYNERFTGVGLSSGATYSGSDTNQQVINLPGPPPSEFTMVRDLVIRTRGQDNDFVLRQHVHFTVNANGEATATVFDFEAECR